MPGPYLSPGSFFGPVSDIHSTRKHELGSMRWDAGRILKYVKFTASVARYSWVEIDDAQFTDPHAVLTLEATYTNFPVGVAEYGGTENCYGWITVAGPATAKVATTAYAGAALRPTGTAGTLGPLWGSAPTQLPVFGIAVATGVANGSLVLVKCL